MFHWYALRTKPHKERSVYELLTAQEIDAFFPRVRVNPVNPRSAKVRPYFPNYMFVNADLDELGVNRLNHVPGTHGLVSFDGDPAIVPDVLIEQLQKRITEIEIAGGLVFDQLKQGDAIRIKSGPFAGYDAIFDMRLPGKDRVQVLLAFLSNFPQRVHLDSAQIEKVS